MECQNEGRLGCPLTVLLHAPSQTSRHESEMNAPSDSMKFGDERVDAREAARRTEIYAPRLIVLFTVPNYPRGLHPGESQPPRQIQVQPTGAAGPEVMVFMTGLPYNHC